MTISLRRIAAVGAGITAVALTATLAVPAALASPAGSTAATPKTGVTTHAVQAAAGWLSTQFENTSRLPAPNGYKFSDSYGTPPSYYVNYGENADAVFALAAAKAGRAKSTVAMTYLKNRIDTYGSLTGDADARSDGAIGKAAVAAEVAGDSPTSFGGKNLLRLLKSDECPADGTTCTHGSAANIYSSISESFVLIAEQRAGGTYAPSAAAKNYFTSLQCTSGGFTVLTTSCGSGDADVDSTSYAVMAMTAMKMTGSHLRRAVAWLRGQQNPAGYWPGHGAANTNSTGLAASALQGAGAKYGKARTWLRSQQHGPGRAAGALRYDGTVTATTTKATSLSVLATAQGLVGLVDGSTLATLRAKGSTAGTKVFAPTVHTKHTQHRKTKHTISGGGFAAGEKVRITLRKTTVATVRVGPLGTYAATVQVTGPSGHTHYTVKGLSSGLTATRPVHVEA